MSALCDPMDCQAPLSMGFSRQEYWSGLPFPSPGDLALPGTESVPHVSSIDRRVLYHWSHLGISMDFGFLTCRQIAYHLRDRGNPECAQIWSFQKFLQNINFQDSYIYSYRSYLYKSMSWIYDFCMYIIYIETHLLNWTEYIYIYRYMIHMNIYETGISIL